MDTTKNATQAQSKPQEITFKTIKDIDPDQNVSNVLQEEHNKGVGQKMHETILKHFETSHNKAEITKKLQNLHEIVGDSNEDSDEEVEAANKIKSQTVNNFTTRTADYEDSVDLLKKVLELQKKEQMSQKELQTNFDSQVQKVEVNKQKQENVEEAPEEIDFNVTRTFDGAQNNQGKETDTIKHEEKRENEKVAWKARQEIVKLQKEQDNRIEEQEKDQDNEQENVAQLRKEIELQTINMFEQKTGQKWEDAMADKLDLSQKEENTKEEHMKAHLDVEQNTGWTERDAKSSNIQEGDLAIRVLEHLQVTTIQNKKQKHLK